MASGTHGYLPSICSLLVLRFVGQIVSVQRTGYAVS